MPTYGHANYKSVIITFTERCSGPAHSARTVFNDRHLPPPPPPPLPLTDPSLAVRIVRVDEDDDSVRWVR